MITEDYINFETAKLLKEKGFAETSNTIGTYNDKGEFYLYKHEKGYNHNHLTSWYSAPTIQMAMKWLREVHNLHIVVFYYDNSAFPYIWYIFAHDGNKPHKAKSYEEASETAIKYCLEKLI